VVVTEDVIRRDLYLDVADGVLKDYVERVQLFHGICCHLPCYRVRKDFSRVETPLFALMLVQSQPQAVEEEVEEVEIPTALPFDLLQVLLYHLYMILPLHPMLHLQLHHLRNNQVAELEQDKHTQALEILKMQKRVKKLEKKKRPKHLGFKSLRKVGGKIEAIDADDDITLVDVETQKEVADMDAELQGRIDQDDEVNAASKGVSAAEPTVFNDEERLHEKEIKKSAVREKQEKDDLERAQVLQKQHDDKEENIDWNAVAKQIQERHLDNIGKYQSFKKKPISIAQARKNMIIYLQNMEYKKVQTLFKSDKDVEEPKKKRVAEEILLQESFKKLKAIKVSVEALQVKYPIIDWEIHSEGSRTYWKIIGVSGITKAYHSFKDMLKGFDKEDLIALWNLVKEKLSSAVASVDKEKALWVKLKRMFEPNADDVIWNLQRERLSLVK
nr:hypothetical protein [Tanacetum cinerariifolium]